MRTTRILASLLASTLAACGGGGGDSGGGFTLSGQAASFTAVEQGALPAAQTWAISITGPKVAYLGAGYLDGRAQPPWLGVDITAGPGAGWTLQVSILMTDLPPGTYTDTFQVGTADAGGNILETKDFTVTYLVTPHPPALRSGQAEVVLGGADGLDQAPVTLTFRLDSSVIASCAYAVGLSTSSGGDWLRASAAAGTVGQAGTSLELSAQAGLPGGTYAGQVRLGCTAGGTPLELVVPVTLNVEAHRLVVGTVGVGLSSAPSRAVLARDVTVRSSLGRTDVAWTASSDQPWLTVTTAGTTAGSLHLAADPAGLAAGATHFATVTVTSSDPTVENVETIRVGLAVRSADPGVGSQLRLGNHLAASPVEPVVFVTDGGTDVVGYDVYSGDAVRTFRGVAGQAGTLAVSGDGLRLFVWDVAGMRVVELDASSGAEVRVFATPQAGTGLPNGSAAVAWARPAGAPVLVTPSSRLFDLATGAELPDRFEPASLNVSLVPSHDGSQLVTVTGAVYRLRRTALGGGRTWATYQYGPTSSGAAEGQACLSADGALLYIAAGAPYVFMALDVATQAMAPSLPASAYPNAIVCAWNGLVVGGTSSYYDPVDVWVYHGPTRAQLATLNSSGVADTTYRSLVPRGLAVSADGTRVVSLVGAFMYPDRAGVRFQSLPPPP